MAPSLWEIAKDLTHTLVETGRLAAEDMQETLQSTYATLASGSNRTSAKTPMTAGPGVRVVQRGI